MRIYSSPQITKHSADYDARFHIMFKTAGAGIGMPNLKGELVEVNQTLCSTLGWDRQDLIGTFTADLTYMEDGSVSSMQFIDFISGKQDYFLGERRYIRKNGEISWVQVTMLLVCHPNGAPVYIVGMLNDIDQQKTLEHPSARSLETAQ